MVQHDEIFEMDQELVEPVRKAMKTLRSLTKSLQTMKENGIAMERDLEAATKFDFKGTKADEKKLANALAKESKKG